MKNLIKYFKNQYFLFTIFLLLIALTSFNLRSFNYSKIPLPGESMDEYSYSWVGLSLIKLGFPIGFSGIGGYPKTEYHYINVDNVFQSTAKGNPFPINYPWFDHPPLLGIFSGGYAYLKGARIFEETSSTLIRKPMLVLGTLTILLTSLYALLIFGKIEAVIVALIYTISPLTIISSRMVQGENGFIPFFLLSLILLLLYKKKDKKVFLILSACLAGLCLLFKISGIVSILTGITFLIYWHKDNRKKLANSLAIFGFISLSFLLFFITYGLSFDPNLFWTIFSQNSKRYYGLGVNAIYDLISNSKITNLKYLTDGWYFAGWISFLVLIFNSSKEKIFYITTPILVYLAVYLFFGSEPYGWYRFPFLPFLYLATAYLICLSLKLGEHLTFSLIILSLPLTIGISKLINNSQFQSLAGLFRASALIIIAYLILSPLLTRYSKKTTSLNQSLVLLFLLLALFTTFKYFQLISPEYWINAT